MFSTYAFTLTILQGRLYNFKMGAVGAINSNRCYTPGTFNYHCRTGDLINFRLVLKTAYKLSF